MCELKDFGPCNALACGQQSPSVGFLGTFSLPLSFGAQKKVEIQFGHTKEPMSAFARRARQSQMNNTLLTLKEPRTELMSQMVAKTYLRVELGAAKVEKGNK